MKALSRWCTLVSAVLIFYSFSADSQQVHQTLARHVPPAVSTGAAKPIGPLPSTQRLNLSIVLPLRNQDQLTRLLNRLYDPSSTDYRHFLSVAEFTAQFGPKEQDFQAVVDYVQANGINVTDRPANRLVVPISGTVEQLQAAFHVAMKVYPHPTENRTFFSPDREPSLALNVPISHIAGLNNFSIPRQMVLKGPVVRSLVSDEAQGSGPGGSYLGSDMRAAYYGGTTLTGAGEVVGFLQFDGYNQSDVDLTFSNAGQSYSVPIQNVLLDGATGVAGQFISPADDAEQVLDIVQAIGMAPGLSQVRVYIGSIDADIFNKMASENVAKQLSVSWTWAPDDPSTDDIFFQEFAAQGQSIFVAAGDYGEYDPRFPSYYPAEDDDVTAVGGTTLVTTGPGGQWSSETAWSRSGGGISPDDIAIPPWQVGVATSSNGGSATLRSVPDVAAEADFDNYDCDMGVCAGTWAGTSFASPRWAGFMALVNQQAEAAGDPPIGLVNQAIYGIGEGSSYAEDFHDITSGNNDYFGNPQQPSYYAVPGYDLVTGWGTPTGHPLIDSLAPWSKAGFLLTPSSNLITIASGSSASVAINVIAEDGFTGKVSLSYSGFPVGIVASWSTNPTSSGSALLLTAANAMTWGQFQITVTGTSGTLTASTTFVLNINAPGFQLIAANGSMRLYPGYADSTAINVVSNAGFNGRVVFSVSSPLPSGVSAIWSQDSDTGNSLLTLWPSNSASSGVTTVRITGVSGSFSATTSIVLDVMAPAILINMSPVPYGIAQGETVSSTITVIPEGSYSDPVSFSIYVPTGVSSSFDPVSATSSTTLTLTASPAAPSNAPVNTYTTVWGFDGDNDDFTEFAWTMTVMVPPIPVFDVTISPQYLTIPEGQSVAVNTTVTQRDGDSGSVAILTDLQGISGLSSIITPNQSTGGSTVSISATQSASLGGHWVYVCGQSSALKLCNPLYVVVVPFTSFSLSSSPTSLTVTPGATVTGSIDVSFPNNSSGHVALSINSSLPEGLSVSLGTNPTSSSSALTVSASASAVVGSHLINLSGSLAGQTITISLPITVAPLLPAVLTSPTPSSTLTGNSVKFAWSNGSSVSAYDLHLSAVVPGGYDLYTSGHITGTSTTVNGLPANGEKIYARLYSIINGITVYNDYTFTAMSVSLAMLTSPAQGSVLTSNSMSFTWSPGTAGSQYDLHLSAVAPGGYDLYLSGHIAGTSTTVNGLPTNGEKIYARLYTILNGATVYNDYTYTAMSVSLAKLTSPVPSSTLTSNSVSFTWSAATAGSQYDLHLSAVAPGGYDLYLSGHLAGTSTTVNGLPTNGEPIFARLYTIVNGVTVYNDYTFTAASIAKLVSPAPSSTLTATSVTFTWSAGTAVSKYDLHLSAVAFGGYDLFVSGPIAGNSRTVYGLPTNGEVIYARLYTILNGVTLYNDYIYKAQ